MRPNIFVIATCLNSYVAPYNKMTLFQIPINIMGCVEANLIQLDFNRNLINKLEDD